MNEKSYNLCECGDYRHQHSEMPESLGYVRADCNVCSDADVMNGQRCRMFRLAFTARTIWEPAR